MFVDAVIVVVVAASLLAAVLFRWRSRDDDHSVEGYHRSIHTLEVINEHPAGSGSNGRDAKAPATATVAAPRHSYPESAVRLTDSATVRVAEAPPPPTVPPPVVPPIVPPPKASHATGVLTFDDAAPNNEPPDHSTPWARDPAIGFMNRRPRQLAAPALAVIGVLALVVVLVVFGSHPAKPKHHSASQVTSPAKRHTGHSGHTGRTTSSTTPVTTSLPNVSAPLASTGSNASYEVAQNNFSLVLMSTSAKCWVSVTGSTGNTIFVGTLEPGQRQTIPATGLVSVLIGEPSAFAATIDGTSVVLPANYQTPLTLHFTPAASASA